MRIYEFDVIWCLNVKFNISIVTSDNLCSVGSSASKLIDNLCSFSRLYVTFCVLILLLSLDQTSSLLSKSHQSFGSCHGRAFFIETLHYTAESESGSSSASVASSAVHDDLVRSVALNDIVFNENLHQVVESLSFVLLIGTVKIGPSAEVAKSHLRLFFDSSAPVFLLNTEFVQDEGRAHLIDFLECHLDTLIFDWLLS